MHEPTTSELQRAYRRSHLAQLGISFETALKQTALRIALRCTARAAQRRYEQQHGKPAPEQPALI